MTGLLQADMTETIGLKRCCACTAELRDRDKFCRRCGIRQCNGYATSTDLTYPARCETKALSCTEVYPSFSGRLIRIVTECMPVNATNQTPSRGWRRLVCTLITIPIWMLIVMLSPLDAYVAARAAAGCVSSR